MQLIAEIKNADPYDRQLIEKLLGLKKLQDDNQSKYDICNNDLELIISGAQIGGPIIFKTDNNNYTKSIDLIVTPYIHKGNKVSINDFGEFKEPENGLFLMEIKPECVELTSNGLSNYLIPCKKNHEYAIFKFPSNIIYSGVPLDVMIYLSYKPKAAEVAKENNQAA